MSKANRRIVLLTLLVMLLWGSLFPMIQLGYKEFSIDTSFTPNLLLFAGIRFTISGFFVSLFTCIKNKTVKIVTTPKQLLFIALVGLTAVSVHYACTYIGLSIVDSSKTAILKQSGVIVFVFFSFLFIKDDKFSIGKLIGAVLGLASIIVLNFDSLQFSMGVGEILIIVASLCTVISNIICKLFLKNNDAIVTTGVSQLIGGLLLLAIGLVTGGSICSWTFKGCLIFVYIILATIVSYYIWYSVVQKYDLSKLFIIKLVEPLFTAIIAALVLKENIFQWQYLVSFILIGVAMFICNLDFPKKKELKDKGENVWN